MSNYLLNNAGTILTGLFLLAIVTMVMVKIVREKKRCTGICSGCSCDCGVKREV
ncbi:FeoB-associated Cys-rich membrane protein [Treponema sp. R80B11-R83G3]